MTETTTQLTVKKETKGNYVLNKRSIHTNTYVFFMFFMKMIKLKNLVSNLLIKIYYVFHFTLFQGFIQL